MLVSWAARLRCGDGGFRSLKFISLCGLDWASCTNILAFFNVTVNVEVWACVVEDKNAFRVLTQSDELVEKL